MKLLYTKRSPYARKARIIAIEKNIKLDLIEEDLTKKSQELLKATPVAKIPALILDNGEALVDSPVICAYLDSLNDKPVLISKLGSQRWRDLCAEAIADGLMDVTVGLYMEKVARHPKDFNGPFVKAQEETIARTLAVWEKDVAVFKNMSIASIAAASALGYLNLRLPELNPKGKYPKLQAWYDAF